MLGSMRSDGRWSGVFVIIIVVLTGCSSERGARPVSTSSTVPVTAPASTLLSTTSSEVLTSSPPATHSGTTTVSVIPADVTTTIAAPANVITRPVVDPAACGSGAKSEFDGQDLTLFPFALGREQPIPLQVFGSPSGGVAKPFAVVVRLSAGARDVSEDHRVRINRNDVGITVFANGNAAAAWELADGTTAYIRARDLDEIALIALVTRLTPRDPSAPIPGFDLQPSSDPRAPVLLHEHLNTGLTGTLTRFECDPGSNRGRYRIAVIGGDPVFVYLGIIDRPRPYAVGVNGDGAVTITNDVDQSLTLQQITDADPATWTALPSIESP
jgi:hypothetical protein